MDLMGVFSEVAIAIRQDLVPAFEKSCPKLMEYLGPGYDFLDPEGETLGRLYHHDYIKWYEPTGPDDLYGYRGVGEWAAWQDLQDQEDYRFVRVGEDYDDAEDYGIFWDANVFLERTINLPINPAEGKHE